MSDNRPDSSVVKWLTALVVGMAAALLVAWLARQAGVELRTLLSIVAAGAALAWLIVLVSAPWNLYFAVSRVSAQMSSSRGRGIIVRESEQAEARRIERRMLWFALGGHVVTALAVGVVTFYSGESAGYYFSGFYLLSAVIRPAVAYFSHLRERISALSAESLHPREDILSLRAEVARVAGVARQLEIEVPQAQIGLAESLRRAEEAGRARDDALSHRVDRLVRQIEDALDGISDHQELQAGLRALVRMIKTDTALT